MKSFLFVMRAAPHSGIRVQEQLDLAMLTAAFDQPVTLLFLDDGVFQLKRNQSAEPAGFKDTAALFGALDLYEIRSLFVETESLTERGLDETDLLLPAVGVARREVAAFMQRYAVIIEV